MLNLATPTDPKWFDRIEPHLDTILVDHTHLEKRAASTALSMIFRYTGRARLPRTLSAIVREEMEHFEQMLAVLDERGVELCKLEPAPYAKSLVAHIRKQEPDTLLDKLIVAGLIEARSCERFKILSERLADSGLADYYGELFESEARHYTTYTDLARRYFEADAVEKRLAELAEAEVEALRESSGQPRLHSW
jgi:tRNA 2-(methylsulfanyl)-N6-isopentenyladenosine37 hydroxylase